MLFIICDVKTSRKLFKYNFQKSTDGTQFFRLCFRYNSYILNTVAMSLNNSNSSSSTGCFYEGFMGLCAFVMERKAKEVLINDPISNERIELLSYSK